jgi:hypothetical protein
VVPAHEVCARSLHTDGPVRESIGQAPCYRVLTSGQDRSFAGGTGTRGRRLSGAAALEIIRGRRGLNLVGADLVEVSPPYDTSGNTTCWAPTCCMKCCACRPAFTTGNTSGYIKQPRAVILARKPPFLAVRCLRQQASFRKNLHGHENFLLSLLNDLRPAQDRFTNGQWLAGTAV